MTFFNLNVTDRKTGTGLYRVWIPVRKDGRTQLISIWIDLKMTAFEQRDQNHAASAKPTEEATAEQIEDPGRCRLHLRAA